MLNLVCGRRSFACRLERPVSAVAYAEDGAGGDRFVTAAEEKVTVHDSEDARIVYEMDCGKRVLSFGPAKNGVLYTGGEDRGITAWDLSSGKVSSRIEDAHSTHVKGIAIFDNRNDGSKLCNLIASASSDGVIRIWDVRMIGNENPTPLAEANTKARLTCLAGTSLKYTNFKHWPPRLKICDFGYSKSSVLHSQPKSTDGRPAYIAPEVLSRI